MTYLQKQPHCSQWQSEQVQRAAWFAGDNNAKWQWGEARVGGCGNDTSKQWGEDERV